MESVDGDESVDGEAVANRWAVRRWTVVGGIQKGDHWLPATDYRSPATGYGLPTNRSPIRRGIRPGTDGRRAPYEGRSARTGERFPGYTEPRKVGSNGGKRGQTE